MVRFAGDKATAAGSNVGLHGIMYSRPQENAEWGLKWGKVTGMCKSRGNNKKTSTSEKKVWKSYEIHANRKFCYWRLLMLCTTKMLNNQRKRCFQ